MSPRLPFFPLLLTIALGWLTPAHAATDEQRCVVAKLDAGARALGKALGCQARAAARATAPDPACSSAALARLITAFVDVEARGGCAGTGDAATVHAALEDFTDATTSALVSLDAASSCAAAKLRATGRAVDRALRCHARAIRHGAEVSTACLTVAAARFSAAFARAEKHADCVTQGDASQVASSIATTAPILVSLVTNGVYANDVPSALAAVIEAGTIHLTWLNPDPASVNTHVKLARRLNTAPTGPNDAAADLVFFGTSESADDDLTALLADTPQTPRTYHYAVFGCTSAGACETTGSRTSLAPSISEALRGGGYVMHWRHAAADVCSDRTDLGTAATTSVPDWWKSCDAQCPPAGNATARQMNATGVIQSTTIGDAFRTRGFPVGRVVSSEFCRNVGTAELMAFGPIVEESPLITFFVHDEASRCQNSYALLAEVPAAGANTALIGHAGFSCPVLDTLVWGEAAIFKPDGAGETELVARVVWDGWLGLP